MRQTAILVMSLTCWLGSAGVSSAAAPKFLARRDYPASTTALAVADMNGDGIPDFVSDSNVWFGNGNGTFRQGPLPGCSIPNISAVVPTDLNGDGKVDLVLSGQFANYSYGIAVCYGNGDGTFQTEVEYQAGTETWLGGAVVGDFNGDGIPDVEAEGNGGVWLFTGKGGGIFNVGVLTPLTGSLDSAGRIAAADFNGDGKLDLVLTTNTGFAVLLGNGNATFQPPELFTTAAQPTYIAAGDLNSDGHPDIVAVDGSSYVNLYFGNGKGGFYGPTFVYLPGGTGVTIGDVNGDGVPDLVNGSVEIAFGKGHGTFDLPVYYPVYAIADSRTGPALAALTSNGRTDIVTGGEAVSVLLNTGEGHYQDGLLTPVPGGAVCGVAADYNGDGKPDLAVCTSQGITVFLGTGKANAPYTIGPSILLTSTYSVLTGDLNGDGTADLLVSVQGPGGAGGTVMAYLGNGDGTFTLKSSTIISGTTFWSVALALGDFNGDGKLDFAVAGNLLALGNGDGTFQPPSPFVPNPQSYFTNIAAGDLNGDGYSDIVLTNLFDNYFYVLINNQHGGFTQSVIDNYSPGQVVFADLNGDGKLDAAIGENGFGGVYIYLGDGHGNLTYKETVSSLGNISDVFSVADVNGDGIPDLLLTGGDIAICFGKGGGGFESPLYIGAGPSPASVLAQNLHGQPSLLGLPDIVVPDASEGVVVLINKTK